MTYVEAKQTEDELIHKYDTVNMGYNNIYSGLSAQSNFITLISRLLMK